MNKKAFRYWNGIPFMTIGIPRTQEQEQAVAKRQKKKRSLQRHRKGKA
jgi:hypothetical protein